MMLFPALTIVAFVAKKMIFFVMETQLLDEHWTFESEVHYGRLCSWMSFF